MQLNVTTKSYVSPEDLFFAMSLMNGKHLDYAYISEMKEIGQNPQKHEYESRSNLVENGFIDEDFLGDIEITDKAKTHIFPIINGDFSACVSYFEKDHITLYRVHSDYKNIVVVKKEEDNYSLELLDCDSFNGIFDKLFTDNENAPDSIDFEDVKCVCDINCYDVSKGTLNLRYGIFNDAVYALKSQSELYKINSQGVCTILQRIFGGA